MPPIYILLPLIVFGQTEEKEASLQELQKRVASTRISRLSNDGTKDDVAAALLVQKPVFRYSDEIRGIEDAGIWLWTDRNRPVAAMKVERYKSESFPVPWLYCLASLSTDLVSAEFVDAKAFQARRPGLKWQMMNDEPAKTRSARLVQMRAMARKFEAELLKYADGSNRTQMRLLPHPLFRCEESVELRDGGVFGFTGTGTNPDLLLLFDLPASGRWSFGTVTMTAEGVVMKLNDKIVYEAAHTGGRGSTFDSWCYFRPEK